MTVGTPAAFASSTGRTRARLSRGASTMPETPCEVKPSTTCTCCSRSSSRSGPFQMILTVSPAAVSSCAACIAPAWMARQNSCVVPFGTTAMVYDLPVLLLAPVEGCFEPASLPPLHAAAASATRSATTAERRVVVNESLQCDEVGRRGSIIGRRECTGRSQEAAELEHDDAFHVIGAPMVARERGGNGV